MAGLFLSLRWAHVAAGSIALILFWIPVISPKGGRTHVRAGWFYVLCMSVVVLTAFVMSALAFSVPLAIRQFTRPLSAAELSQFVRGQRIFATFLAYLAGVTLALGWQGIWAVETRRATKHVNMAFGLVLNLAIVLGGLTVLVLGIKFRSGPLIGLSPWALAGSAKSALLAERSTIAHALVVHASWLDGWHRHCWLHRLPGVRRVAIVSCARANSDEYVLLGATNPGGRACHPDDGLPLPAQIP